LERPDLQIIREINSGICFIAFWLLRYEEGKRVKKNHAESLCLEGQRRRGETMGKGEKMDKEAARRIQSAADRTGENQDFKERAQRAAAKHEQESKK